MEKLTKSEEEIMLVLWNLKKAFVKEIVEELPNPKPHYNTVSTIVKILQEKGFVKYTAFGKTHQYYPCIEQNAYLKASVKPLLKNYFSNSATQLVSFFVKEKNVSVQELETLINELKNSK